MLTERFGLVPCALCLWQRWPYWVAAGFAVLAGFWGGARRVLIGVGVAAVLVSGGIGVLHAGVEQGWWPSPLPSCRAANAGVVGMSVDELLRGMAPRPDKPCDAATFLIPGVPVSMAGMNVIYALGVAAIGLIFLRNVKERG